MPPLHTYPITFKDFAAIGTDMDACLDIFVEARAEELEDRQDSMAELGKLRELEFRKGYGFGDIRETRDPATYRVPCQDFVAAGWENEAARTCELQKYTLVNHTYEVPEGASEAVRRKAELRYIDWVARRDDGRLKELTYIIAQANDVRPSADAGPPFVKNPIAVPMENVCNVCRTGELTALLWVLRDRLVHRWGCFYRQPRRNIAILSKEAWHITPPTAAEGMGVPLVSAATDGRSGNVGNRGRDVHLNVVPGNTATTFMPANLFTSSMPAIVEDTDAHDLPGRPTTPQGMEDMRRGRRGWAAPAAGFHDSQRANRPQV